MQCCWSVTWRLVQAGMIGSERHGGSATCWRFSRCSVEWVISVWMFTMFRATIGELSVGGIGGAGPDRMGFSYEWDEEDIRQRDRMDVDVLVSHCPPLSSDFDRIPSGDHVGSQAVREQVEQVQGVAVFGHIHESFGVGKIADCLCMNLVGMGPPMAHPRAGWVYGTDAVVLRDVTTGKDQCAERHQGR
jgi:hypothetical protein